jgi:antitoxin HigA-1
VAEHPGAALRAAIHGRGWTVHGCALVLDYCGASLNRVARGERPLGVRLALHLEAAGLGTAAMWVGLQTAFELARARARLTDELDDIRREAARG